MKTRDLTRRDFLRASAVAAVGLAAASCAQPTPQVIEKPVTVVVEKEVPVEKQVLATVIVEKPVTVEKVVQQTVVVEKEKVVQETVVVKETVSVEKVVTATPEPVQYKEAPMLADLVKAGKLPPVAERLPLNPCVLDGLGGIGKYGGTLRRRFEGTADTTGPDKMIEESMWWFTVPGLEQRANIIESWEINADGSQWTLHLRKGMKWSDGAPFDASAFQWNYEHVLLNETLTGSPPRVFRTGDPPVMGTMEFPDDFTVVAKFANPNPLWGPTTNRAGTDFIVPGHYVKQFHIDTTDDPAKLQALLKETAFNTWDAHFENKASWFYNADVPVFTSMKPVTLATDEVWIVERNPYFWQVDSEGNQLPYLDRMQHRLTGDANVFNLWIVNGEIDYQARGVDLGNYTLFKENEAKGDFRLLTGPRSSHQAYQYNMTCKDKRLADFFSIREVRFALSYAMDRDLINEMLYDGMMTPRQYSPMAMSPQYYPEMTNNALEYDPAKANKILDDLGYTKRDSEGYRLWTDGTNERMSMIIEGRFAELASDADQVAMVISMLKDIGLDAQSKTVERSLIEEHYASNDIQVHNGGGDRCLLPLLDAGIFVGLQDDRPFDLAWSLWYKNNSDPNGVKPPDGHWIWDIWKIWGDLQTQADTKQQNELFKEICDIWIRELPFPGLLGEPPAPYIVKNGLNGFVEGIPYDNTTGSEGLPEIQTFWWDDPSKH